MKHISKGAKLIQGIVWEWLPYMPSQKTTNYQLLVKNGEPIYMCITNDQIALSLEFTPFYDQADDALTPNLTLYEGQ